jgi:hypothetical protein
MSTTEKLYAKLLEPQGHGYPIYIPTSDLKVGDVGSFVGKDFARRFNVFELTREVFLSPLSLIESQKIGVGSHEISSTIVSDRSLPDGCGTRKVWHLYCNGKRPTKTNRI